MIIESSVRTAVSRVLLVDDDPRLRRVISHNLTARGRHVRETSSVATALASLALEPPGLLVRGVNPPDWTGWDVLPEAHPAPSVRVPMLEALPRLAGSTTRAVTDGA